MKSNVRVRFAPSPTGLMHIGGVRTALFNYLFAKHYQGKFILRLEDTDRDRFVDSSALQIIESLNWLGLKPDEGFWMGQHKGEFGPYIQSERLPHYQDFANKLVEAGLAYYSIIDPADYKTRRDAAIAAKQPFVYRQSMEPKSVIKPNNNLPIRLKVSRGTTKWRDEIRGDFDINNDFIDDFIIIKADGFPTYNFANVVDDHLMKISHVIRGDEFISSTPKHVMLYDALKWERPYWIHLPVINGASGKKLSKRDGDTDLLDYRAKGYLPAALINFLVSLGWNDGSTQEIYSISELVAKFSIDRILKSPAIFDRERLDWINGVYIREKISQSEYLKHVAKELNKSNLDLKKYNQEYITLAANLERDRIRAFGEVTELLEFFFLAPRVDSNLIELVCKKNSRSEITKLLTSASIALSKCSDDEQSIEQCLRYQAKENGVKPGELFYPIRVAITGKTAAPGLFATIHVLGITESVVRIKAILQAL